MHLNTYQKRIRHFWLYALALEQGKYYVGITTNLTQRIRQHGGSYGARWTQRYKPVEVLEIQDLGVITNYAAEKIEQALFEDYVKQYGLRNVRGGRITSLRPVYKLGIFYADRSMLESLFALLMLLFLSIYYLYNRFN